MKDVKVSISFLKFILTLLPFSCYIYSADIESQPKTVTIPKFTDPVKIDGNLDLNREGWKGAVRISDFVEEVPNEGGKPAEETEVLLGYDDYHFYIGFICHESDVSKIRATAAARDRVDRCANDDMVIVMLDPHNTNKMGYLFMINPYGVQVDAYIKGVGETDVTFDIEWYAEAEILEDKWAVEIGLPFRSLRFPSRPYQHWRINFRRIRPRENMIYYSWIFLPRRRASIFTDIGHLYINETILTERRFELLPYIVGQYDHFEKRKFNIRSGISGKYWISSNSIFDWAVNPDYAQIEADAPQIDINRVSALYYAEKRPFFLEKGELFKSPIEAVYTRMVNDPLIALKFTGGSELIDIGFITAIDRRTPWVIPFAEQSFPVNSGLKSLTNILRLRWKYKDGHIGLLGTDRELIGSFNRVLGIDAHTTFLRNYHFTFQGLRSWTKEPNDTALFAGYPWLKFDNYTSAFDGEDFTGDAFTLQFSRKAKRIDFDLWYKGCSPRFRTETGFINFNDFKNKGMAVNFEFRPKKWKMSFFTPGIRMEETRRYSGEKKESNVTSSLSFQFKGLPSLTISYKMGSGIYQGHFFKEKWSTNISSFLSPVKFLSVGMYCIYGKEINYFSFPPELGNMIYPYIWFDITPLPKVGLRATYGKYLFWDKLYKEKIYDMDIFQGEIRYLFFKYLTGRVTVNYSSSNNTKQIELFPLVSFTPSPFTVCYIGSNHTLGNLNDIWSDKDNDHRVFVKVQYLFGFGI